MSAERQILFQKILMLFMVTFRNLQCEIEKWGLPSRGWTNRNNNRMGVETTCLTEGVSENKFRITFRRETARSSFYLVVFGLPK
jgi:hypothetical protein